MQLGWSIISIMRPVKTQTQILAVVPKRTPSVKNVFHIHYCGVFHVKFKTNVFRMGNDLTQPYSSRASRHLLLE